MTAIQTVFPAQLTAKVMGVLRRCLYCWIARPSSVRTTADWHLSERIGEIHTATRATYCAPRIHAVLAGKGINVDRKRVENPMKAASLVGVCRCKGSSTTIRDDRRRPASDLIDRNFRVDAPGQL